ncbi:MAG: DUF4838 domain-containing protein [Treponemataceae bacterium]|nr:DUF4838 domain-containing protein [Treponemataceae bacterium]
MVSFNTSLPWHIVTPSVPEGSLQRALEILSLILTAPSTEFPVPDTKKHRHQFSPFVYAPTDSPPPGGLILLDWNNNPEDERHGFSWRIGKERIEIHGTSPLGLSRGIYHFLRSQGYYLNPPGSGETLRLYRKNSTSGLSSYHEGGTTDLRQKKRLFLGNVEYERQGLEWIAWAAWEGFESVIIYPEEELFSLETVEEQFSGRRKKLLEAASFYGITIEEGGYCLSRLVPRRLFRTNKELFRMESGKRVRERNFCPTNPETLAILARQGRRFFQLRPEIRVFHLWPDQGEGHQWCACPTCRAFSPLEQELIAINSLAAVLQEILPGAFLSYLHPEGEETTLSVRPNVFALPLPNDGPYKERDGWEIAVHPSEEGSTTAPKQKRRPL